VIKTVYGQRQEVSAA